jgi:hypothetical protein
MKWTIIKDSIEGGRSEGITSSFGKPLGEVIDFRLLDDDGTLYYEGIADKSLFDTEEGFEPLDYFGVGSGCVDIQYLENGLWETL